jgi:hypothetical protein
MSGRAPLGGGSGGGGSGGGGSGGGGSGNRGAQRGARGKSAEGNAAIKGGQFSAKKFRNPREALGHAVALLHRTEPFASYKFGRFTAAIAGQVRRGHYIFTFEGERIVGYFGWARCTEEVAEAWVAGAQMPAYKDCLEGPCLVAMTFHATSRRATVYQARRGREINANCKIYIPREYTDGRPAKSRAVFNRILTGERPNRPD